MKKVKVKPKNTEKYMLCFHDFSEEKRQEDIFLRLRVKCKDTKDDIFKLFNKGSNSTAFIRTLFNIDVGHWRLIHIEKTKDIPTVDYDLLLNIEEGNNEIQK